MPIDEANGLKIGPDPHILDDRGIQMQIVEGKALDGIMFVDQRRVEKFVVNPGPSTRVVARLPS